MSYRLTTFDGLTLPTVYPTGGGVTLLPGTPVEDVVQLVGGRAYDALRTERARRSVLVYEMDCALLADSAAALLTAWEALVAKDGVSGTLTRKDDADVAHTLTARMAVDNPMRNVDDGVLYLPVKLRFTSTRPPWLGTSRTATITHTGSEGNQTIANNGNADYSGVVLTITAGGTAVTSVAFTMGADSAGRKWKWTWTGSLSAGQALVIDCGAFTVLKNGVAAYSGWVKDALHNQSDWMRIRPGGMDFAIVITDTGGADPTYSYQSYDGHN